MLILPSYKQSNASLCNYKVVIERRVAEIISVGIEVGWAIGQVGESSRTW